MKILFDTFQKASGCSLKTLFVFCSSLHPTKSCVHLTEAYLLYMMGIMHSVHLDDVGGSGAGIWPKVWLYEIRLACAGSAGG